MYSVPWVRVHVCADVSELEVSRTRTGVTLLSQLASMPSMSPLIDSPVPSVGSVVPNMQQALHNSMVNGLYQNQQQLPEVGVGTKVKSTHTNGSMAIYSRSIFSSVVLLYLDLL